MGSISNFWCLQLPFYLFSLVLQDLLEPLRVEAFGLRGYHLHFCHNCPDDPILNIYKTNWIDSLQFMTEKTVIPPLCSVCKWLCKVLLKDVCASQKLPILSSEITQLQSPLTHVRNLVIEFWKVLQMIINIKT